MKNNTNTNEPNDPKSTKNGGVPILQRPVQLWNSKQGRTDIIFILALVAWLGWSCVEHGIILGLAYIVLGVILFLPFGYVAHKIINKAPKD